MAASLRKAQIPIRARGSNKCPQHAGKEVIFLCEDCGELICSKCVWSIHRKHAVDDISRIIPQVKVTIQDFVNKAETKYIPELNSELKYLDDKISGNKSHFKKVISDIAKQNETLKQELDRITNKLIASCREAENKNDDILKKHREELQSKIEELNARLLELKDTLQSGTNTQVYDTSREILNDVIIFTLPSIQEMDFKPTSFLISELEKLVGEVLKTTSESRTQMRVLVLNEQRADIANGRVKGICNERRTQPDDLLSSIIHRKFKNRYVETFFSIDSICATSNNQVWVNHCTELRLLDNTGVTQKIKKMGVRMVDFCVSSSTSDIWFCSCEDNSVRKVTGDNKSTVMFNTENEPLSICIAADGNILVGMRRQIVKYTQRRQILCKSGAEVKWFIIQVPVVRDPRRISLCPVTRNIAVVDLDSRDCGGDNKPHVSILDDDLQLLCRYYGRGIGSFYPEDVCYSDTGDIYIANDSSIQRISGSGEFLQTVYTQSDDKAKSLCVQPNGDIWAVFKYSLVKFFFNIFKGNTIVILQKQ